LFDDLCLNHSCPYKNAHRDVRDEKQEYGSNKKDPRVDWKRDGIATSLTHATFVSAIVTTHKAVNSYIFYKIIGLFNHHYIPVIQLCIVYPLRQPPRRNKF
jgi:hypothetical protein